MKTHCLNLTLALLSFALFTACGSGGSSDTALNTPGSIPAQTGPTSIPRGTRVFQTDALLYMGSGTWATEVAQLRSIFSAHGLSYAQADETTLNAMSVDDLAKYGMIVWPGGYGSSETAPLSTATKDHLREAVRTRGVGYVGFCAGAFVAVNPIPAPGKDPAYGLALVPGPMLDYYSLEAGFEQSGKIDLAMTMETFADGSKRDLVWYGGPVTPEIPGGVVARYPDQSPAITQIWSGNGFVMLSAVHPTAPQSLRDQYGLNDTDGEDLDIAWNLLDATLRQHELQAF